MRGWEVQCIVDFMYKGETSVPEAQLTHLIKAAEGLKVRGLTSSDHSGIGGRGYSVEATTEPYPPPPQRQRYQRSPSPRYHHNHGPAPGAGGAGGEHSPPHAKLAGISTPSGGGQVTIISTLFC